MECDWITAKLPCETCEGEGVLPLTGTCFDCLGTGEVEFEGPEVLLSA